MLKESQNRIKAMGLIHEKLYRSEILASIDFKAYIKMLVDELIRSYGVDTHQITVMIEVEDVFLDVDTAIPCGLIINELVSNSLKHAFPDGRKGEITLSLHSHNGNVILIVNDDGVGIPDSVDLTTTETLGLRLVSILVEGQLEGEITLTKREGTAFRITFRS
jgi:two-component sensor histidine kinase